MNYAEYESPEWNDFPLHTGAEQTGIEAKKDALEDSFKSFQDGPAHNLQRNMLAGNATPAMLRDAVRRLCTMLEIAGEVADYQTEAQIVHLLNKLGLIASQTLYS
ncbi:hypothetical protein [Burkholderia multivorans]|uniref:hypothetical protein n=1 Tax=Burkholderia multivorans TaxID=87883 RepID=UPI001C258B94|nr:hypothetical protein [Burkholderia multivorans]MBU9547508.1 hypothetical protein [Burkholderia multivorans]